MTTGEVVIFYPTGGEKPNGEEERKESEAGEERQEIMRAGEVCITEGSLTGPFVVVE